MRGKSLTHWRLRILSYATGVWLLCLTAHFAADGPNEDPESEPAEAPVPEASSLVVTTQEGAESPRAAIAAFAAASNAGDLEATLALIDPQVRPLIEAEALVDEYILEQLWLRNMVMTEEQRKAPFNSLGAIPVAFAKRDLLRTSQIEVLSERPSPKKDDRVLLDVNWEVRSFHSIDANDRFDYMQTTLLAVKREERWYLFYPFGMLVIWLRDASPESLTPEQQEDPPTVMRSERVEQPGPTTFNITFAVPLEVVHENLAEVARYPETEDLVEDARKLVRFKDTLQNRAIGGDFRDEKELTAAFIPGDAVLGSLLERQDSTLQPAVKDLIERLAEEPDLELKTPSGR